MSGGIGGSVGDRREGGSVGDRRESASVAERRGTGWERWLPTLRRHAPTVAGHAARATIWSLVHFAAGFAQQVAELCAPLLFVVGAGWYALPHLLGLIETKDSEMQDVLGGLAAHVPSQFVLADHVLTPRGLLIDGLLLMAAAAALSTLTALLSREFYRR